MITIKFLQAGNGDCIYIHDDCHHVIIDSGEHCPELQEAINLITEKGDSIDLLVISHYDSDHIKEMCNVLQAMSKEERKRLLKKVWFNATKVGFHGNETNWSETDATDIGNLLLEADIPWVSELKSGMKETLADGFNFEVIEGGEIYTHDATGKSLSNAQSDWNRSLAELEPYVNDKALDRSKTNRQSSILVAHLNGHDVLLPGDAVPSKLLAALKLYGKDSPICFDLVKMPHHGSYKNITEAIIGKIECMNYMITTDGTEFFHPNKKTILKVTKWGKKVADRQVTFHMNYYDELFPKLGITEEEMRNYGFKCDGKRAFEF